MKIAFFSNYFNHHQKPFADAMNALNGVEYFFVSTEPIPGFRKKLGYKEMTEDYVIDTTRNKCNIETALNLAKTADVAIFMAGGLEKYIVPRLKLKKLTFEVSERRFKKGYINMLSPNLIKHQIMYYLYGRKAPLYMICCSAYAPNDYNLMGSYINRCYKWAYFTKVDDLLIDNLLAEKRQPRCKIMWCSRFIDWKHPELCIELAKRLSEDNLNFEINMYGNGPLLEKYKENILSDALSECIHIMGNRSNEEILAAMQRHNIFLFTSDRNEGWGAVANEAMSNGCVLIGSDQIGSIPFLVKDQVNGRIFRTNDANSLYNAVVDLVRDRSLCEQYAREAYFSMKEKWNPQVAAERFIQLANALQNGRETPFQDGPCSKAIPLKSIYNN